MAADTETSSGQQIDSQRVNNLHLGLLITIEHGKQSRLLTLGFAIRNDIAKNTRSACMLDIFNANPARLHVVQVKVRRLWNTIGTYIKPCAFTIQVQRSGVLPRLWDGLRPVDAARPRHVLFQCAQQQKTDGTTTIHARAIPCRRYTHIDVKQITWHK
jgi:hypothetical protein